ncbi:MAG: transposase [Ignavibacteria bacterium]|nr:transposase [Ignavibacteria bacterium]
MRSRNKIYNSDGIYFVTSTIVDWIEIFNSREDYQILIDAINYNIRNKNFKVYAYVLMKNHFHIICTGDNLSNILSSIKSFSAKKILKKLHEESNNTILNKLILSKKDFKNDRIFQVWQEGFYPKEILDNDELIQKIEYIHYNPVKGNYCENIIGWEYSSAKFYESNEKSLIQIERLI